MDEQKVTIESKRLIMVKILGILTISAIKWNLDDIENFKENNC